MGIGYEWLQLLLICWERGLFSCSYWFCFISFLKGSALHQLITGTDLRSELCSAQLLFLVTSPDSTCRGADPEHSQPALEPDVSAPVHLSVVPLFSAWHSSHCSGCHQGGLSPHHFVGGGGGKGFVCWYFCLSRLVLDDGVQQSKKQSGACASLLSVFVIF